MSRVRLPHRGLDRLMATDRLQELGPSARLWGASVENRVPFALETGHCVCN